MACYHPHRVWQSVTPNPSGTRPIIWKQQYSILTTPISLPCGQCIGCRLENSRQWAIRCFHEASLYKDNCFITLTYNEQNLPEDGSLNFIHFQLFMKRLRKKYPHIKIKYFHCGEYGDSNHRPHYHACIFNFDFPDKEVLYEKPNELFTSPILNKLWPFGFSTIGEVNFETAAYVARYIMKKINGAPADGHYVSMNEQTGEITPISKEYATMSNGIGKGWYQKFKEDVYPDDHIILNNRTMRPPKYYDNLLLAEDSDYYKFIKAERMLQQQLYLANQTPERLAVREKVTLEKLNQLTRKI